MPSFPTMSLFTDLIVNLRFQCIGTNTLKQNKAKQKTMKIPEVFTARFWLGTTVGGCPRYCVSNNVLVTHCTQIKCLSLHIEKPQAGQRRLTLAKQHFTCLVFAQAFKIWVISMGCSKEVRIVQGSATGVLFQLLIVASIWQPGKATLLRF